MFQVHSQSKGCFSNQADNGKYKLNFRFKLKKLPQAGPSVSIHTPPEATKGSLLNDAHPAPRYAIPADCSFALAVPNPTRQGLSKDNNFTALKLQF